MKKVMVRTEKKAKPAETLIGLIRFGVLILILLGMPLGARGELLSPGAIAPDVVFLPVNHGEARASLGVPGKGTIRLQAIQAKAVIINLYSLYCPPCHREASRLNRLQELISAAGLAKDLKLVGLAAGNSAAEVTNYQQQHAVSFPLFQDPSYFGHKALGSPAVPSFYVIQLKKNSKPKIVFSQTGEVLDEEAFLKTVLQAAGLAPKK